jgi:hypothetical protein
VDALRVIGVTPKPQPHKNQPMLGPSAEETGKFIFGNVPVESDGSAYFRVPSGVPVFFQALDVHGVALQTMRSLTYVAPGRTLACVGCHESRDTAPPSGKTPLASLRKPSRFEPAPIGSWPLRFDVLVQPILNEHCVNCHRPDSADRLAARLDLRTEQAYASLLGFGNNDLHDLAFEKDRSYVGQTPARQSKLLALLQQPGGHEGVELERQELNRIVTWMDVYAQTLGSFSLEQEDELRELREQWSDLFDTE